MQTQRVAMALNTTTANTIVSEVIRELLPGASEAIHNLGEALLDGSTGDKQQIHALLQTLASNPALIKYADKKANNARRTKAKRSPRKSAEESNSASASWRWVSQEHYHSNGARKRNRRKPLASSASTASNPAPVAPTTSTSSRQPTISAAASIPTSTTCAQVVASAAAIAEQTYQSTNMIPFVSMTPVLSLDQEPIDDGQRRLSSEVELESYLVEGSYPTPGLSSPSSSPYYSDADYSSSSEHPSSPFEATSSASSPSSSASSASLFHTWQQGEEDAVAWALEEAANASFASQLVSVAPAQLPTSAFDQSSMPSSSSTDEGARNIDAFFSELAAWGALPPIDMVN